MHSPERSQLHSQVTCLCHPRGQPKRGRSARLLRPGRHRVSERPPRGFSTSRRECRLAQGQPELLQAPVPWLQPSNLATCSRDGTASEGDGAAQAQLPALPVPRSFLQGALPQDASRLGARSANSQVALTTHSLSKYVFSQETSA